MCRFVAYVGQPITLDSLLFLPRNSLINQSVKAEEFEERLNGDGFGVAWYAHAVSDEPALFRSVSPAWSNRNLQRVARVVQSETIFAHVRAASPGMLVIETNCHPFSWGRYTFMHNGSIGEFGKVRRPLRRSLSEDAYDIIEGTTDSEHLFAAWVDAFEKQAGSTRLEAMAAAMVEALQRIETLRREAGGTEHSYINAAVTDGRRCVAVRYTSGPAEHASSLYLRRGHRYVCEDGVCRMVGDTTGKPSVMICSERISDDSGWEPVPAGSIVLVDEERNVEFRELPAV